MKKNLTFKIGLFCAALVLVATCFVTSAWAKYTKTVSATDSARVAKFDVTTTMAGDAVISESQSINIFGTTFDKILQNGINVNADSGNTKLIAPGSHGEFSIVLSNSSEVAVDFHLTAVLTDSNIPLYFRINEDEWFLGTTAALTAELEEVDGEIVVGGANKTIKVEWAWFYDADHAEILGYDSYVDRNSDDTTLGEAGSAVYTVTVTSEATQVIPQ